MGDIGARDGLVLDAWMAGDAMHARIKLTTEEGIRDFLGGRIDRFSISWFRTGETQCSVCGKDWFGADCPHVPGESYLVKGETGNGTTVRCELVQVGPVGREISAVNVPASSGTQVLAELVSLKESLCAGAPCKGCACAEAGKESFQEDPVEAKAETKAEAKVDGEEVKDAQAAAAPLSPPQPAGQMSATGAGLEEPQAQPPQADSTGPALDELAADLAVVRDETFGPVLAVVRVEGASDAVAKINAGRYGLGTSIWTRDTDRARRLASRLDVGVVTVNNHAFTGAIPALPWSGTRETGFGVANSALALPTFVRPRAVVIDSASAHELYWPPYDRGLLEFGDILADVQRGVLGRAWRLPLLLRERMRTLKAFFRAEGGR
jgi:hypothetical protein